MLVMLQRWSLCVQKNKKSFPYCFSSPFRSKASSSLSFLSLCCECQGCQCHSLTWLVFLTRHQEADGEQGERAGMRSHIESQREKSPTSLLWGSLITEQLMNHPGFFSFIQLACFSTPGQIPKVWIYSVRSKSEALITDKTEFVIQQILGSVG